LKAILNILADFFNLIYPICCIVCDEKLIIGEKMFCTGCLSDIPKTRYKDFKNNEVSKLFWGRVEIEAATSLFYFSKGSKYRSMIHKMKYHGQKEIGYELGKILANEITGNEFNNVDIVIPVPLHDRRKRSRGYNQSTYIAKGIAEILNKPLKSDLLVRKIYNISQTGKGRFGRWENVEGIFELKEKETIQNKKILLVDDIITTGSTIEACVHAIKEKVNSKIFVCSLAITQ